MIRESVSQTYLASFLTFERNVHSYNTDVTFDWLRQMIEREQRYKPRSFYFTECQFGAFTENDRTILVEWFTEIALSKHLPLSAVIRATSLMDRYFSTVYSIKDDRELTAAALRCNNTAYIFVAMMCFNIAVKVEGEKSCIPLFIQMCKVSSNLLIDLEAKILQALEWEVFVPTSLTFAEDCLMMLMRTCFLIEPVHHCPPYPSQGEKDSPPNTDFSYTRSDHSWGGSPGPTDPFPRFCKDVMNYLHLIMSNPVFLQFSPSVQACAAIYLAACVNVKNASLKTKLLKFLDELKTAAGQNITAVQKCGQALHCFIRSGSAALHDEAIMPLVQPPSKRIKY